jgi:hypothetical protein
MSTQLYDFLPEEVSDEAAFYIINLFVNITSVLEARYFAQMRRYRDENTILEIPLNIPEYLKSNNEDNNPV